MTQAHDYAMLGMGHCGDEYGKRSELDENGYRDTQLDWSGHGAFTLAECKLQCDLYPNCHGVTVFKDDYIGTNWCSFHSVAYKARGDNGVLQCYSKIQKVHVYIDIYFYKCIQLPGASDQPAVHDPKV